MIINNIWVVSDGDDYDNEHILQLISKAYQLSCRKKAIVSVIFIGTRNEERMKRLFAYGANKVIYTEYSGDDIQVRIDILKKMIKRYYPTVILFPASKVGKHLASAMSIEFKSGLTAECIDISLDVENEYIFSRAALNASVIARIKCVDSMIHMCTIKRNVFKVEKCDCISAYGIEKFDYDLPNENVNLSQIELMKRELHKETTNNEWQSSKIVFAIGRGVADDSTVELINALAKRCGAGIIGTRAAVEEGLIDKKRQVGQSGASICPNIYVGFGVSGASQHMVGIKNAATIIAINNDKNAPIFNYADFVIVDDLKLILDELNRIL